MSKDLMNFFNLPIVEDDDSIQLNEIKEDLQLLRETRDKDLSTVRAQMINLTLKTTEATDKLFELSVNTQGARPYEVLQKFISTLNDLHKSLIDLHVSDSKIGEQDAKAKIGEQEQSIQNNTLVVGSTDEIQRILEEARTKKIATRSDDRT